MENIDIIYQNSCPNCGKDISLWKILGEDDRHPCVFGESKDDFSILSDIFTTLTGTPWGAQRLWIRRFLKGESFALIAPTGSGKTTTSIAFALYLAFKKKKSIFLAPTSTLIYQIQKKFQEALKKIQKDINLTAIHSLTKKPNLNQINIADIILTTSTSLVRNDELFKDVKLDCVFVDDVDGFLKRSKAIDKVFNMIGVSEELLKKVEILLAERKKRREEDYYDKIQNLENEVRLKDKQIIISGATKWTRKTKRVRMLDELLGFDVGSRVSGVRNVIDSYILNGDKKNLFEIIKKLKTGGVIYLQGAQKAIEIESYLTQQGVNVKSYIKASKKIFDAFSEGKIDLLVGTATTRSSLVRGIDLPEIIKYAVFYGVPKFSIKVNRENFTPARMLTVFSHILNFLEDEDKIKCGKIMEKLRRIQNLNRISIQKIIDGNADNDFLRFAQEVMEQSFELFEHLSKLPKVVENSNLSNNEVVFPDATTYIQASGRTSRLTLSGMTKGISVLLIDDKNAFHILKRQLQPLDVEFVPLETIDLNQILDEIEKTRKLESGVDIEMKSTLLVVESPTKSKTIARFFGRPLRRTINGLITYEVYGPGRFFIITSSRGHFYDLNIQHDGFGAVYENGKLNVNFILQKNVVDGLRKLASFVDEVFIATDPDAEGEKIAWDIRAVVSPYVGTGNVKRITYHEVTKKAILNAFNNPSKFNKNLLFSQLLRRIEDAWIGLPLSKFVQTEFKQRAIDEGKDELSGLYERWLSAGRVQSAVLGWIVNRTKSNKTDKLEFIQFQLENGLKISVKMPRGIYKKLKSDPKVQIVNINEEIREKKPPPPYTTDTLLQVGIRNLYLSSEEVMKFAQDLFESGLITYHRTDSTSVSSLGIEIAKKYLISTNKEKLFYQRKWGEEGAHECIRPTKSIDRIELENLIRGKLLYIPKLLTKNHLRLYDLIFKRFVASQMTPAKLKTLIVTFKVFSEQWTTEYNVELVQPGFYEVAQIKLLEIPLKVGEYKIVEKPVMKVIGREPLYSESDIIRIMKEKGIGRPSTYAPTLQKIKKRGYVFRLKSGQLVSTNLGSQVYEFLKKNYEVLINEERTKKMMDEMDNLENNKVQLIDAIKDVYDEINEITKNYLSQKT